MVSLVEAAPRAGAHRHEPRPTPKEMLRVFNNLATRTETRRAPAAERRSACRPRTLLIVITADRGPCGSFNTNVVEGGAAVHVDQPEDPQAVTRRWRWSAARAATSSCRRGFDVLYEEVGLFQNDQVVARAGDRADGDQGIPRSGHQSRVYLVYNEFKSGDLAAAWSIEKLLPIPRLNAEAAMTPARNRRGPMLDKPGDASASPAVDYLFEPDPTQLLDSAAADARGRAGAARLLESNGRRTTRRSMQSMDSRDAQRDRKWSTRLTLYMNKVRQAAITRDYRSRFGSAGD